MELFFKKKTLSSFQIIIFGFLAVILVGTLLLMLPFASREPGSAPFLDALFTATSATCVTGLIVHDTATYWSCFGQVVILLLIQIGGMGVVTITIAVAMVSGKKIGLMQRSLMQESISAPQVGGIVRFTGFFLKGIALIELLGAILLAPVFIKDFGVGKGIWYGVFHSISAFCNAGFDLMGVRQQYSSLTYYAGNGLVNAVIVLLILIGGLGFLTWEDIKTNKLQFKKYRMQSKVILVTDLILVIVPTVIFYFGEFHGSQWGNGLERFWLSLFQAVTPRTAGFNTADLSSMRESGQFLMILLMLVGGAPGSTAGGMKVTTLAVLAANLVALAALHSNIIVIQVVELNLYHLDLRVLGQDLVQHLGAVVEREAHMADPALGFQRKGGLVGAAGLVLAEERIHEPVEHIGALIAFDDKAFAPDVESPDLVAPVVEHLARDVENLREPFDKGLHVPYCGIDRYFHDGVRLPGKVTANTVPV